MMANSKEHKSEVLEAETGLRCRMALVPQIMCKYLEQFNRAACSNSVLFQICIVAALQIAAHVGNQMRFLNSRVTY